MGVLSKLSIAASRFDHSVKQFLFDMFDVETVDGTGTTQADAAQVNVGRTMLTIADGTVGWILPKAIKGAKVELVNTVSNQTAKIYAAVDEVINAVGTTAAFSLAGGARGVFHCDANTHWYVAAANLTGTSTSSSTAELDTVHSVTAGTVAASKAVVVDSVKSVDVLQTTTALSVGGTGVPGAASVDTMVTKAVTAFTDTTAKDVFTVTVPNTGNAAAIEVDCLGVLGAGGTVGTGDSSMYTKYLLSVQRTAGAAAVATVGSLVSSAKSTTGGGDDITSVVVTASAMTGAVDATQSFTIKVAITKAAGASANHTGVFAAKVLNQSAAGVTIA